MDKREWEKWHVGMPAPEGLLEGSTDVWSIVYILHTQHGPSRPLLGVVTMDLEDAMQAAMETDDPQISAAALHNIITGELRVLRPDLIGEQRLIGF